MVTDTSLLSTITLLNPNQVGIAPVGQDPGMSRTVSVYNTAIMGISSDQRIDYSDQPSAFVPQSPTMRLGYGTTDHLRGCTGRYWATPAGSVDPLAFINPSPMGWTTSGYFGLDNQAQAMNNLIPIGIRQSTFGWYNAYSIGNANADGADEYTLSSLDGPGLGSLLPWSGARILRLFGYQANGGALMPAGIL